jgi:hypothetical protein
VWKGDIVCTRVRTKEEEMRRACNAHETIHASEVLVDKPEKTRTLHVDGRIILK